MIGHEEYQVISVVALVRVSFGKGLVALWAWDR